MESPTQIELSELKDQIQLFKDGPVWQHVLRYMQSLYADAAEEALGADDITKVKWASGIAHAVRMISNFDENIPVLKRAKESK
jgi:hypothetical protein